MCFVSTRTVGTLHYRWLLNTFWVRVSDFDSHSQQFVFEVVVNVLLLAYITEFIL